MQASINSPTAIVKMCSISCWNWTVTCVYQYKNKVNESVFDTYHGMFAFFLDWSLI